jgi:acetyl-CoA C-acetyltransferase/potassium large conductance calcium-activated channel subfamily M alpha protein 1
MAYLSGDPLTSEDLMRAKTQQATACILLTNKNSPMTQEEDYRNILIALAIKKFYYDEQKDRKDDIPANVRICMQLIKPESKDLYYKSLNLSPLQD